LRRLQYSIVVLMFALAAVHAGTAAKRDAAPPLEIGTVLLSPKDTYLNTDKKNYSTATTLMTYTWPDNKIANAILMKFDLATIPAGAIVTSATLQLALVASDKSTDPMYSVAAHKVIRKNPNVLKATGFTADGVAAWTANNCCQGAPMAQADLSPAYDVKAIDKSAGVKSWTITTMVQEWLANPATNMGVLLNSDASKKRDRYRTFASMEYADATKRPVLKVTFAAADVTPPAVSIAAPQAGEVSGLVPLTANASDNVAVAGVQFKMNGTPVGPEVTAYPYTLNWDTTSHSDGTYSLTAVAKDTTGNTTTSAPIIAAVKNGILYLSPQDTSLSINSNNYSTDPLLMTYTWPDNRPANAILMKFDLASVPPGSVVSEATLFLSLVESDAQPSPTYSMSAKKVVGRNPVIAQATGYNADAAIQWTPNACCQDSVPLAQADMSSAYATVAVDKVPGFKAWTITDMVQEWLFDPLSNFGVVLNADASKTHDHYRYFASMENAGVALRPVLRVTYSASGDTTPPALAAVSTSGVTANAATINWTTDEPADSLVEYGLTSSYGSASPLDTTLTSGHNVTLSGLADATQYHFRVRSRDQSGNATTSGDFTFTTPDGTAPAAAMTAPANGATVSGAINVTANASDNVGVAGVQFALDGANLGAEDTSSPYSASWNTTTTPDGNHTLTAVARDAAGNTTQSAAVTVTVSNDLTLPAVSLTSPTAGATVSGTITVAAGASDNVGVAGVQFKRDGVNLGAEDTSAPYSTSWNTTGVADGNHTLTATARDAAGNVTTSTATTVNVSNAPPPPPPPPAGGLSGLYPGDVGIESNANVVFVERFDEASLANLFGRWTDVLNGAGMSISNDAPAGSPVGKSLTIPWSAGNTGGHLYRQLTPGVDDTLYIRYYVKYPSTTTYNHTGIWMGGYNPPLGWPNPQAGVKPTGSDRFIAAAEQNTLTNAFDHYDYWMGMHPGDGSHWGNLLLNNPGVQAAADQWVCVEQMVKLNSPVTALNGEHAIWLNGVKVSHVGQGFPKGVWSGGIFTQDPGGTPFEGLQWRNNAALNLNWMWLQVYSTSGSGNLKYAHVVAAKSYIGCLASGSSPTPPTVSVTSPASGATVSGTSTVSANAADDVGVVGVQFKVDGANLGVEDTTAPYSVAWNTTTIANGSKTLTAVARDAAGNVTTSAAVTVTVSNSVDPSPWPNDPPAFRTISDQQWDLLNGNGWNFLRRTGSKDPDIVADATAPFSAVNALRMIFTTDMQRDSEPSVHWIGLSRPREVYSGWWMKVSANWTCSPAGCGKITFLFPDWNNGAGVTYSNLANAGNNQHYVNIATTWPSTGYKFWEPNVTKTIVNKNEWFRVEWYVKWESSPGAGDGIIRWWVNGVLNGDYRNVPFPAIAGFLEFQHAPTLQNVPSVEQYMYIDHTRVRTP